MKSNFTGVIVLNAVAIMALATGCSNTSPVETQTANSPTSGVQNASSGMAGSSSNALDTEAHPHIPGAHGGIIVPIGADSYHAEAVVEKSGSMRLLLLGKDESRIQEVDVQPLKAYVKGADDADATAIELVATPQEGDTSGKTSQFVGQLPEAVVGKPIDVTIPNLRIGDERFRVGFSTAAQANTHETSMPAGVPTGAEQNLYLTPGGKYTLADIQANGNMVASKKFKGQMSAHDMNPQKGDRICPVTLTKANPKFTWIINASPTNSVAHPASMNSCASPKNHPINLKIPISTLSSLPFVYQNKVRQ
ncbi:MAG: hypothetical protein SFV81_30050 [Pirellulaceae bacterium]|nr:hypothetical protein [Pirellulaceae bacterium]